jgi:hypothetical protein
MSTLTWEAVLTDLETRVDLAEQALDEGAEFQSSLLQPWTPPEGLGPLPAHLRERAITIIAMQAEVEQRINTAMDQLGREIGQVTVSTRKVSAYGETVVPKYFDNAV